MVYAINIISMKKIAVIFILLLCFIKTGIIYSQNQSDSVQIVFVRSFNFIGFLSPIKVFVGGEKVKIRNNRVYEITTTRNNLDVLTKAFFRKKKVLTTNEIGNIFFIAVKPTFWAPFQKPNVNLSNENQMLPLMKTIELKHNRIIMKI